jgi:outer membrane lipoprotein-sorting protein
MKRKITLVADGTKMIALVGGVGPTRPHEVPKWLGEASRNGFARGGAGHAFGAGPEEKDIIKEFKADEQFAVADFKLGKKEMVNQQEAQVVEYTLTLRKSRERKFAVSVWIDTKTQLPFKHALTEGEGDNKATVTETYSKVTVDEKIDPKQFELPKE